MPETIGQRLKREREARYLSLEKAAEETRIRRVFLQALEADDFSVIPSAAQGRGFLRIYAGYLDLDIDELVAEIQRNPIPPAEMSGPLPQINLVETELPPLTESAEEKPAPFDKLRTTPRFLSRLLNRKPKAESAPEAARELQEPSSAEEAPMTGESTGAGGEAKQGGWGRIVSRFRIKAGGQDSAPAVVVPEETLETDAPRPATPANAIMAEIGAQLRERREMISLTFAEVERHTRLRANFVKALEEGAFDQLPSTVQTRGMLANYATFLGLDVDEALLRYADALQARRREKYAETPRENIQTRAQTSMPALRMFIAGDLFFGLLMVAALTALAVWGVGQIVRGREEPAQPTAPPIVDVLGDNAAPTPSPDIGAPQTQTSATPEGAAEGLATPVAPVSTSNANVTVGVFALERVFVVVSVDGKPAFEGRMLQRETKIFEAENQVVILTGDGSALRITYNGTDLGLMGGPGEVLSRVYSVSGVATPTATVSPTPTNTPLTTPTFTPTATPTATAAPTETP